MKKFKIKATHNKKVDDDEEKKLMLLEVYFTVLKTSPLKYCLSIGTSADGQQVRKLTLKMAPTVRQR